MPVSAQQNGYVVAFRTDIGYAHTSNQDAGLAWAEVREDGVPVGLLVVADGVSAGEHSEEASRITSEDLRAEVLPVLSASSPTPGRTSGSASSGQACQCSCHLASLPRSLGPMPLLW
jgi:hypothetical protein